MIGLAALGANAQSAHFEESSGLFYSREPGFTAVFRPGAVEFQFRHARPVTWRFRGAGTEGELQGRGLLAGHTTYLLGKPVSISRWFDRLEYRDLYPGIDLIFRHEAGRLEYDLVAGPGADPALIELSAPPNMIRQRDAIAYQEIDGKRKTVPVRYRIEDKSHLGFRLGNYDRTRPLVIDPVIVYTNYAGGNRTDTPNAVAVDGQGNVYLAGSTDSYNFTRTQDGPAAPLSGNMLVSQDEGKTYTRAAINNAVLAFAALPNALLAGTTAGPYRSSDGGATWQPSSAGIAGFAANALWSNPSASATVYAGTGQGLFRSGDSGLTWSPAGTGLPASAEVDVLTSSPLVPGTVFAIADQGVYRSQDSGQTWTAAKLPISPIGPAPTTIAIDPENAQVIYVAGAYNNTSEQAFVLKSADGGATYQQVSNLAILTSPQAIAVDPRNSSSVFAAGIDGSVYHSADGGSTWTATALAQVTLDAIAFDPYHPGNLYAVADQGLQISTDHGVTWLPASASVPKRDLNAIFFTPTTLYLGQDAGQHAFLTKWNAAGTQMLWSILLGGSYFDDGLAVAVDSQGNPYLAGTTGSTDFPVTPGAFQTALKGFQNIFVAKLDVNGTQLLDSTLLGGSEADSLSAMAIDSHGSTYLTGYAVSPDFPTTPGAYQPRHVGSCNNQAGGDAFVSKFAPDASALTYSTLIGGSCAQTATGIAVDASGDAYISGATVSPDFPVTAGVLQPAYGGSTDGFVSELNPAGSALVFSTYLGGQNSDLAAGVSVDSAGNIYVAGNGNGFAFQPNAANAQDECGGTSVTAGGIPLSIASPPYLMKLAAGARSVESLESFADCGTVVQTLAVDLKGKSWLSGIADPSTYDTVAPFQALGAGGYFVRQFAADAQTTLFSTLFDSVQNVALDSAGAAYVAAEAASPPSASVFKIDASVPEPVAIDTVQKVGTLSISALLDYEGPIGVAPGEIVALQGHGFSGAQVTFGGVPAQAASIADNRIVCMAPFAVSGAERTQILVVTNLGASNPVTVPVVPAEVEILGLVNQDGTVNSAANPAAVGSTMSLYASGLGLTAASAVSVVFDDPATITYLGPAPGQTDGVTQINFVVAPIDGQSVLSVNAGNSTDYAFVYVR